MDWKELAVHIGEALAHMEPNDDDLGKSSPGVMVLDLAFHQGGVEALAYLCAQITRWLEIQGTLPAESRAFEDAIIRAFQKAMDARKRQAASSLN